MFSTISLMLSTELWDAPSISRTSREDPLRISLHDVHSLHGSVAGPFPQFRALERILATEVFPTPLGPVKRNAWEILPRERAFFSVEVTCSWPTTSSKVRGLYFSAKT